MSDAPQIQVTVDDLGAAMTGLPDDPTKDTPQQAAIRKLVLFSATVLQVGGNVRRLLSEADGTLQQLGLSASQTD